MESDQLPLEVEHANSLNSSEQGDSPEAIALSIDVDESKIEGSENIIDISESSTENITGSSPEHNEVFISELEVIANAMSQDSGNETLEPTLEKANEQTEQIDSLQISDKQVADDIVAEKLATIEQLKQQEIELKVELEHLKNVKTKILQDQIDDLQSGIIRLAQADVARLEYQKQELQSAIAVLEKRKDRLDKEMTSTYAGASQDIAVRVQGFKDYLVGSLQDLVASAEKLNLVAPPAKEVEPVVVSEKKPAKEVDPPLLSEQTFAEYKQRVEQLLERYRTLPDYYGPAWKLRRTFEQVHADRVAKWFFEQSGRGAIRTMGTRLQNILVTSAAISVLKAIYGDKLRVLVLATSPERLGEWRRGFQDCLGLTREHFGSEKGIALFEDPEPLATKGDRLVKEGLIPLVIIDESEELISVDLLRFPLLIAFGGAPDAKNSTPSAYINRDSVRDSQSRDSRDYSRDFSNDYASKDQRSRDYGARDYSSQNRENRDYGRDSGGYGGGNRGRNNQDSDWDW